MSDDRHNIAKAINDGADFPASPVDSTAGDLGQVIGALAALAPELNAPVVTEDLRLAQYRRAAELGRWIVAAADDLGQALATYLNQRDGQ